PDRPPGPHAAGLRPRSPGGCRPGRLRPRAPRGCRGGERRRRCGEPVPRLLGGARHPRSPRGHPRCCHQHGGPGPPAGAPPAGRGGGGRALGPGPAPSRAPPRPRPGAALPAPPSRGGALPRGAGPLGSGQGQAPAGVRFTAARATLVLGLLLLATAGALALSVILGEYPLQLSRALADPSSADGRVLFGLRIPRAALGAMVGASLAASGSALQALLRNPLADSFVLGVSGGAALGATLALALGLQALAGPSVFAFLGAVAAMTLVLAAGRARSSPYAALLTGVVFNAFAAAIITCIKTLLTPDRLGEVLYWLAGSIGYEQPRTLLLGGALQLLALGVL